LAPQRYFFNINLSGVSFLEEFFWSDNAMIRKGKTIKWLIRSKCRMYAIRLFILLIFERGVTKK
jgi:hypothetical protein